MHVEMMSRPPVAISIRRGDRPARLSPVLLAAMRANDDETLAVCHEIANLALVGDVAMRAIAVTTLREQFLARVVPAATFRCNETAVTISDTINLKVAQRGLA